MKANRLRVRTSGSFRCGALSLLALAAAACDSGDSVIAVDDRELVVERLIDGDSPFWGQAPYLFEGPFACPLPSEVLETRLPQAHEVFVIENEGGARSLEIRLEGSSFDSGLTAEPLLLVYPGTKVPDDPTAVAACLAVDKPGGGAAATVTVPVGAGESVTAIALEAEIGPGIDGDGSGRFRLRVLPPVQN